MEMSGAIILESEKKKAESGMNFSMYFTRKATQKANSSIHKCVFPLHFLLVCILKKISE